MTKFVKSLVDYREIEENEIVKVLDERSLFYYVEKKNKEGVFVLYKEDCEDYDITWLDEYLNGGKKTDGFEWTILISMGLAFGFMLVYILIKLGGAL